MIIGFLGEAGVGKDTAGAIVAAELGGVTIAFADPMKRFCSMALGFTERQLWGDQKWKPISKKRNSLRKPGLMSRAEFEKALAFSCGIEIREIGFSEPLGDYALGYALQEWWWKLYDEEGLTPRRVLQTFGTEFGRQRLGRNFWVERGLHIADHILQGGHDYSRLKGLIPAPKKTHNVVVITDVRFRNEVLAIKKAGGRVYRIIRATKNKSSHLSETEMKSIPTFWCDLIIDNCSTKKEFEGQVKYLARSILLPYVIEPRP